MPRRALLLLLMLLLCAPAQAADEFEKEFSSYEQNVNRPPLVFRFGAMNRLARTKDPRALEVLSKRYRSPRVPKVQEQYLLAGVLGTHFTEARHVDALWKLLDKFKKDEAHAWLFRNVTQALATHDDVARIEAFVMEPRTKPMLQAAALEGLAARKHPAALPLVVQRLDAKLPKEGPKRMAVLDACASVLLAHADQRASDAYKTAASKVVDLLARDDVGLRTKLVIARYLRIAYHADKLTTSHAYWRRMLGYDPAPTKTGGSVVGRPRFYGVEAAGSRVGYVLDMSDSMLEPLTDRERRDAQFREERSRGENDEPLPWESIQTRFDLARAYLKQSVAALTKNTAFVVVTFGHEARALKATKGLVLASRGTIKRVLKELDGIKAGSATRKRPHGTLQGDTNLHTALLRVFRAVPKDFVDEEEDVDPKALERGCDTIFLFGDGKPTRDDFDAADRREAGRVTVDRETGETRESAAGGGIFFGPYIRTKHLIDDVRRMNLLRKAEIHTISIGEADHGLMRGLAEVGHGRHRSIGMLGREARVTAWWLVGAFPAPPPEATTSPESGEAKPNAEKKKPDPFKGWETTEGPEKHVSLKSPVTIRGTTAYWDRVFGNRRHALINLRSTFPGKDPASVYAYAEVHVEEATAAKLRLGCDDGVRVWLNEALVHSRLAGRGHKVDQDTIELALTKGTNRILLKLATDGGAWRFSARLTDAEDKPLDFLMP